jgi:hypothetical protein
LTPTIGAFAVANGKTVVFDFGWQDGKTVELPAFLASFVIHATRKTIIGNFRVMLRLHELPPSAR